MLKPSIDRKVANSFTPAGAARIANSFGLPAGNQFSCPTATTVCEKVCYVNKISRIYKGVDAVLHHNWNAVKDADYQTIYDLINVMLMNFRNKCEKFDAPKAFRIHWSGDFFDGPYTMAWHDAILYNDDIQFWVYTRNDVAARILMGIDNLSLYFSTDKDNVDTALALHNDYGIKLAFLGQTFVTAKELGAGIRSAVCPEQRKQIALNGACVKCGICLENKANIAFSISKK